MRRSLIVLAMLGGFLSACATAPPSALAPGRAPGGSQMSAGGTSLSGGGTRESGPTRKAVIRQPVNLARIEHFRHPRASAMLRGIMDELLAASGGAPVSPDVAIINSPSYNAVLQNNRLYVTRGMLALMNDRSEMAAILAHEIGHVLARHARRRVAARNQAIASAVDVAKTFRDPELTRKSIETQKRSLAAFSREQEYEADRIGNALMVKAGFDPAGAVRSLVVHERMKGLFGRIARLRTRKRTSVLATHPPTLERIARARRQVAGFRAAKPPGPGIAIGKSQYLAAIDGLLFGGANSNSFIRGRNFISPARNVAVTMPPGFVPTSSRSGILAVRRGGKSFVIFSALKPRYAADPEGVLDTIVRRMGGSGGIEQLKDGRGAIGFASTPKSERRIAILVSGRRPYSIMMFTRKKYPGLDRQFRSIVASVRAPSSRDLAIARPWRIRIIRATGPRAIARYAKASGSGATGEQLLLALNGLRNASQVKAGMQLKVMEFVGR